MTERVRIHDPPALAPPRGYSHVAEVRGGKLVFVAGQVALDPSGAVVGPGDYRAQTEQVFRNLGLALESAGATFRDLVKLTYFVRDMGRMDEVRTVRDRFIDPAHPPASTAVEVSALYRPEILLVVEAVASVE